MTTLAQLIVADASSVFLDTAEFAELCTLYPGGDYHQAVVFTGQVFRDDEEGTREVHGDGTVRGQEAGDAVRRSITVDALSTIGFDDKRDPPDLIKITASGEIFTVVRIMGRAGGMQRIRAVRVDKLSERKMPQHR